MCCDCGCVCLPLHQRSGQTFPGSTPRRNPNEAEVVGTSCVTWCVTWSGPVVDLVGGPGRFHKAWAKTTSKVSKDRFDEGHWRAVTLVDSRWFVCVEPKICDAVSAESKKIPPTWACSESLIQKTKLYLIPFQTWTLASHNCIESIEDETNGSRPLRQQPNFTWIDPSIFPIDAFNGHRTAPYLLQVIREISWVDNMINSYKFNTCHYALGEARFAKFCHAMITSTQTATSEVETAQKVIWGRYRICDKLFVMSWLGPTHHAEGQRNAPGDPRCRWNSTLMWHGLHHDTNLKCLSLV